MYQKLFSLQEELFKILANQKRLEIIQLLDGRELSVSQMIDMLGLPQANLSQHLALMRQANIVTARREGHIVRYSLTDQKISEACHLIKEMLQAGNYLSEQERTMAENQQELYPIVKDAVCGMRISISHAGGSADYEGEQYYFCASGCKEMFQSHPEQYIKKEVFHG